MAKNNSTKSLYTITCKICGAKVKTKGMYTHLKIHNMTNQEYYDKFMKKDDKEDICSVCGGKNKFKSITAGYTSHCCVKCSSLDPIVKAKLRNTNKERYGVEYSAQRKDVMQKIAETNKIRYGGIAPSCSKEVQNKTKETWLKNYGVDHPMRCPEIKNKLENYFIDKFGVKSPLESIEIQDKISKTGKKGMVLQILCNLIFLKKILN